QILVADLKQFSGAASVAISFAHHLTDLQLLDLGYRPLRDVTEGPVQVDLLPRVGRLLRHGGIDERKMERAWQDGIAVGEYHRAFDAVLQLADISRPAITLQGLERGR